MQKIFLDKKEATLHNVHIAILCILTTVDSNTIYYGG